MSATTEFIDKVVLVTGSSSGIGQTTALVFAKLGAKVVVTGRDQSRVDEVADQCKLLSPQKYETLKYVGDLGEDQSVNELMDLIVKTYNQLDVVVNNAGRGIDRTEPSLIKSFDDLHRVNLRSIYLICIKALPLLEVSKGVIINNSSICGLKPFPELLAYCVSKAGLDMMTRCLAIDLGPKGIRVNSVCPGQIQTPIFARYLGLNEFELEAMWRAVTEKYPLKRPGNTDDVAKAIVFLASNESSFITGVQLKIDGGFMDSSPLALP
ncbi:glucose 1-dehydrogenase-like [Oppia nitens]|uniref:glucose 1-dehydrogenase-like n=1 Tax=Oppia nitens TaxID=1686743 RepID=UPI0023DB334F|nr:glucose 1-dehydrogenase-like [Oppia nitens]